MRVKVAYLCSVNPYGESVHLTLGDETEPDTEPEGEIFAVLVRQHLDVVGGHDQWRHREPTAQELCDFRPTLFHRRQQLSH